MKYGYFTIFYRSTGVFVVPVNSLGRLFLSQFTFLDRSDGFVTAVDAVEIEKTAAQSGIPYSTIKETGKVK